MSVFVSVAALLLFGAIFSVLVPLLRKPRAELADGVKDSAGLSIDVLREQLVDLEREYEAGRLDATNYAQEKSELETRALEDSQRTTMAGPQDARRPLLALALALGLSAAVVGLYVKQGSPQVFDVAKQQAQPAGQAGHALTPQQIAAMVERLSERLLENPNDGQGWQMLARSYGVLGRHAESAAAYARAISLLPPNAQLLADFADTLAMTQGRRLQGEPEKLVLQALEVDPRNVKALALSGTIAFERKDFAAAIGEWRKILALVPEDSTAAASTRASIADAENRVSQSGAGTVAKAPATPKPAAAARVSGSVALDPSLRDKVVGDDVVFVFAHAVGGPRMPLAILRKRVADLPFEFSLDDSMAMGPNVRISQFEKVYVGARVSKSGDALPRSGDLEGLSAHIAPGAVDVKISIRTVVK
jgi:cytochrome c-type biogenesis protein CcmH